MHQPKILLYFLFLFCKQFYEPPIPRICSFYNPYSGMIFWWIFSSGILFIILCKIVENRAFDNCITGNFSYYFHIMNICWCNESWKWHTTYLLKYTTLFSVWSNRKIITWGLCSPKDYFMDILSMYYHSHFIPFLLSYKFNILFQILKISNWTHCWNCLWHVELGLYHLDNNFHYHPRT
jgi:hypothetical protein